MAEVRNWKYVARYWRDERGEIEKIRSDIAKDVDKNIQKELKMRVTEKSGAKWLKWPPSDARPTSIEFIAELNQGIQGWRYSSDEREN